MGKTLISQALKGTFIPPLISTRRYTGDKYTSSLTTNILFMEGNTVHTIAGYETKPPQK
jgi:hypothetical protein